MGEDKKNNPGSGGPAAYVPTDLCSEYRAHIETKIDNMEKNIKATIESSFSTIKIVIALVGLGVSLLQLAIHFWG